MWSVTPSLHTPLMSVTNAISSVIIVGAIIAALAGSSEKVFGLSSFLALRYYFSCNKYIWWFFVTQRMLQMYKKER